MTLYNKQLIIAAIKQDGPAIKFIMTQEAILFFPIGQEHKDMKVANLSYEDDYKGNAVAGIVIGGKPEIRFHKSYSDGKIKLIWDKLVTLIPSLAYPTYQGRKI